MGFRTGTAGAALIEALGTVADAVPACGDGLSYAPVSKAEELRYTFGPVYAPGAIDSDGEYAEADDLRKALWDFSLSTDRRLRKQHGRDQIGDIVELVQWPYEQEVDLAQADGTVRKVKLPKDTVYMGVRWSPEAWDDVKAGRITGYSMGGAAVRVRDAAADGDLLRFGA